MKMLPSEKKTIVLPNKRHDGKFIVIDTIENTPSPFKNMKVTRKVKYIGCEVKISGTGMFDVEFDEFNEFDKDNHDGTRSIYCTKNGITYTIDYSSEHSLKKIKDNSVIYEFRGNDVFATYRDGSTKTWDEEGNLRFVKLSDGTKVYLNSDADVISLYSPDGTEYHMNNGEEIKNPIKREFVGYELKKEILTDGTEREYCNDGSLWRETLSDGTERKWYRGGDLYSEKLPDGTEREWYRDEKILEKLPDGTEREWYKDEKPKLEKLPDGTEREWYRDGKPKLEKLPDGTERKWYENGNQESEKLPDGTERKWYENGNQESKKLPDGTERKWYKNGNLASEKLPDGTERKWYKNGNQESEKLPDGTEREWYESGNQESERLADGTECEWYENGNRSYELLPDGSSTFWYKNGNKAAELNMNDDFDSWDDIRSDIKNAKTVDIKGSHKTWYENGHLVSELSEAGIKRKGTKGGTVETTFLDGTTQIDKYYDNGQVAEQKLTNGQSFGFYIDGSKKFEEQPNGSRQEWHLNGKLSAEILYDIEGKHKISEIRYDENGKRTHFEHLDKDGKDDTRMYLAKQKVAAKQVEKGAEKGKVQKKLNPISKAWKLHKALKEVDSGK